jgi:hypothetical protein
MSEMPRSHPQHNPPDWLPSISNPIHRPTNNYEPTQNFRIAKIDSDAYTNHLPPNNHSYSILQHLVPLDLLQHLPPRGSPWFSLHPVCIIRLLPHLVIFDLDHSLACFLQSLDLSSSSSSSLLCIVECVDDPEGDWV